MFFSSNVPARAMLGLVFVASVLLSACGSTVPLTESSPTKQSTSEQGASPQADRGERDVREMRTPSEVTKVKEEAIAIARGDYPVVYFDFDSYVIKPEFRSSLESAAKYLATYRDTKVRLAGHTDDLGGREYNLALGQRRAEAVRHALGLLGVQDAQMEAVSFGKEKPAVEGVDEAARAKNRRVEITRQ